MSKTILGYHFVFTTKYRRRTMIGDVGLAVRNLIREAVSKLDCEILTGSVSPEHVHLLIKASSSINPADISKNIKGFVSFKIHRQFPKLAIESNSPSFWSRGYFVASSGHEVQGYISHHFRKDLKL